MFDRLKRWLTRRPNRQAQPASSRRQVADAWSQFEQQPLSLDAQLAIANGRMTEQAIREGIRRSVRRFRENASDNPASLWAMSFVDPYDWAMDTPDFYPGAGLGGGGWGVPWLLNHQPNRGDFLPAYINEMGLKLIRDWSRRISVFNEFALNAIENRISYIVGKGFQYSVVPKQGSITPAQALDDGPAIEPDSLAQRAQAVLDEFIARERWSEREQECVRRCDRDGEAFLRFFHVGQGRAAARFIEPEFVTQQHGAGNAYTYGINTSPEDVEDVQSYSVVFNQSWTAEEVSADEVLHIKLNADFTSKRGLPTLFPVRKNLERADKLLRNMSVMAQVQATFAVIRKHKQFAPSSVSAFEQGQSDLNVTVPSSGRSLGVRQLMPGSIIDASDLTEYEFPSANVDSSGLVAVLQAELRAIAARLVMPEYMLTVDASNANFASTMVAESPFVKFSERVQSFFARHFGDGQYGQHRSIGALWRVLKIAVDGGLLPPAVLTDLEIQCEGPSLVVRNKVDETNRGKTLRDAGLLSNETWAKWESLDYQQELKQGAKPQAVAPPASQPEPGTDGGEPKPPAPPGSGGQLGESVAVLTEDGKMVFGRCIVDGHWDKLGAGCNSGPVQRHADKSEPVLYVSEKRRKPASPRRARRRAALALAKEKYATNPAPTEEEVAAAKYRRDLVGNNKDRAKRRAALLQEFGDGKTCPCVYCGCKLYEKTLEQDKIITTAHGGRYRLPNLVPACSYCNKHRSDMLFGDALKKVEVFDNG